VFDHITLRVSDVDASRRFYETALAPLDVGEPSLGPHFFEWGDLSIVKAREDRPVTRRAHVAVAARSREYVDAFWRAATEAGFRDNGPPGLRPEYHETYYGAFVLDPDGNNIEAVHHGREPSHDMLDHAALRVADVEASKRFYTTALAPLGFGVRYDEGGIAGFGVPGNSLWLLAGEPSQNVHVAFAAPDNPTVDEWHRALLAAGHQSNGPPGERPAFHAGYYGAFVLDPDGNNVEAVSHNR
jgi:catechol 2,3-dioxygenase-like lactoylglutathione lyase family enzyme